MAFVAILTSVISASYYLRIVVLLVTPTEDKINKVNTEMTLTKEESLNKNINNKNYINNLNIYMNKFINKADNDTELLTSLQSYLISTLTLFILLFIFKPTILLNSTYILALSLFNS
jgi:NADH-ubiquinone oxidoreductase chain 2